MFLFQHVSFNTRYRLGNRPSMLARALRWSDIDQRRWISLMTSAAAASPAPPKNLSRRRLGLFLTSGGGVHISEWWVFWNLPAALLMISSWTPDIESDEFGMKYRCPFLELSFKQTIMGSMTDCIQSQWPKCYQQQQEQQHIWSNRSSRWRSSSSVATAALQQPRCSSSRCCSSPTAAALLLQQQKSDSNRGNGSKLVQAVVLNFWWQYQMKGSSRGRPGSRGDSNDNNNKYNHAWEIHYGNEWCAI